MPTASRPSPCARSPQVLGTGPASLYRYVAARDELIDLMVDPANGEIDSAAALTVTGWPTSWRSRRQQSRRLPAPPLAAGDPRRGGRPRPQRRRVPGVRSGGAAGVDVDRHARWRPWASSPPSSGSSPAPRSSSGASSRWTGAASSRPPPTSGTSCRTAPTRTSRPHFRAAPRRARRGPDRAAAHARPARTAGALGRRSRYAGASVAGAPLLGRTRRPSRRPAPPRRLATHGSPRDRALARRSQAPAPT